MSRRSGFIFGLVGLALSIVQLIVIFAVPRSPLHIAADAVFMLAWVVLAFAYWQKRRSRHKE